MRYVFSDRSRQCGFAFVEWLVVIAIIGALMGLLLPAVQNAWESGRSNSRRSNLTNLQRAMTSYEVADAESRLYVNAVGLIASHSASWSAMLLPYLEQGQLWDQCMQGKDASACIETFVCPSSPSQYEGGPAMSCLVNAGWIQRA